MISPPVDLAALRAKAEQANQSTHVPWDLVASLLDRLEAAEQDLRDIRTPHDPKTAGDDGSVYGRLRARLVASLPEAVADLDLMMRAMFSLGGQHRDAVDRLEAAEGRIAKALAHLESYEDTMRYAMAHNGQEAQRENVAALLRGEKDQLAAPSRAQEEQP